MNTPTVIHPASTLTEGRPLSAQDYYQQIELWMNSGNTAEALNWAKAAAYEMASLEFDRAYWEAKFAIADRALNLLVPIKEN